VKRSWPLLGAIAAFVFALDMWTKRWAIEALEYEPPMRIIGDFVRLTFTKNSGVAFGLGAGSGFPYYIFSIIAALLIIYLFARHPVQSGVRQVALALILGGALGNLVDRVTTGEVVDFIEIGWKSWHWPVFNVADSAVIFGLTWARHGAHAEDGEPAGEESSAGEAMNESSPGSAGPGDEQRRAAGPLPGRGADGPLA
jgi:signal peptidase II